MLFSASLFAQNDAYYNSITPSSSTFITELKARIRSPYTQISYDAFKTTNIPYVSFNNGDGTYSVFCVYSGYEYVYTPPFAWTIGTYGFSREHTWCQSWMPYTNPVGTMSHSDQHHLFPVVQNAVNSVRNNHPLGIVTTVSGTFYDAKIGTNSLGKTVYEPRNNHKGDAARAMLYMCVRYDGVDGNTWTFNWLNNTKLPSLTEPPQDLATLIQWHKQDPPDKWEVERNNYIASIQQNRNPFVDHPEYVNYINFNDLTKYNPTYSTEPDNYISNLSTNVSGNSITLNWNDAVGSNLPSGYLIEAFNKNNYFIPIDGEVYTDDTNLDSVAVVNVAYSDVNNYTFSNLSSNGTYYFRVYSYNGDLALRNYKISGTVPSTSATTGSVTLATEPTNYVTSLSANNITQSSITLNWTDAVAGTQAPSGYLILANNTNTFFAPIDGTIYTDDATLSDGSAVINLTHPSTGTYSFSSLISNTNYYFQIYSYNGSGSSRNYKTDGTVPFVSALTGISTLATEPTNYVTNFSANNITQSSITLNWTDAVAGTQTPSGYLILANNTNTFSAPIDGTIYTDDAILSDGSAVINLTHPSTGTYSFSSLISNTNYYFQIYSYNGSGSSRNYKTDGTVPSTTGKTQTAIAGNSIVTWNFNTSISNANYSTNVINQASVRTTALSNAAISNLSLNNTTGVTANTLHRSSNWGTSYSDTKYLEFSVSLTNGNIFANDNLSLSISTAVSSGTGNYRVMFQWGNNGYSQSGSDVTGITNTAISSLITNTIPAPGNVTTNLLTIRIHGWHSLNTANIRIGDIQLVGQQPNPVRLSLFNSSLINRNIKLNWTTTEELNNSGFEIERKEVRSQNTEYSKVTFVTGNGTKNTPTNYSYEDKNLNTRKYKYRLKQIDFNGNFEYFNLNGEIEIGVPKKYDLSQNYPNPFNPTTKINFDLPNDSKVELRIYDMLGREVSTLVNEVKTAGYYTVEFNVSTFASGTYFYRLNVNDPNGRAGDFSMVKKLVILK